MFNKYSKIGTLIRFIVWEFSKISLEVRIAIAISVVFIVFIGGFMWVGLHIGT